MLRKIHIENFRSLRDVTLELCALNVLVGANGSGKSSVLHAFQFAVSIAQYIALVEGVTWNNDEAQLTIPPGELLFVPQSDVSTLSNNGNRLPDKRENSIVIELEDDGGKTCRFEIWAAGERDIWVAVTGQVLFESTIKHIDPPCSIIITGLAGLPICEAPLARGAVRRIALRGDANSVFRNVMWLLKTSAAVEAWDAFLSDLQSIFPRSSFQVDFNEELDEEIEVLVNMPEGRKIPIDSVGTGFLQVTQILAHTHFYQPVTVLLDEPDSHMHPDNQRKLSILLRTLAERGKQVLLTTHSRHILDALDGTAKVHWLQDGRLTEYDDSHTTGILLDLGALDKGDRLKAGNVRCLILSEDEKTDYLDCLLRANGFVEGEYEIWSYKGCSKQDTVEAVCMFLAYHTPGVKLIIHRDSDFYSPEDMAKYRDAIARIDPNIMCYLTTGTDVESEFISPSHIKECFSKITVKEAETFIQEATERCRDKAIRNFINFKSEQSLARHRTEPEYKHVPGDVSAECHKLYDAAPDRYRIGKKVVGALKDLLQKKLGGEICLRKLTDSLKREELCAYRNRIWNTELAESKHITK